MRGFRVHERSEEELVHDLAQARDADERVGAVVDEGQPVVTHVLPAGATEGGDELVVGLLMCIASAAVRPVAFDEAWRTSAVVGLASAVDGDRAFDRLPILADALEDGGCGERAVLDHCGSGRPHGQGCYVVDLALGRE